MFKVFKRFKQRSREKHDNDYESYAQAVKGGQENTDKPHESLLSKGDTILSTVLNVTSDVIDARFQTISQGLEEKKSQNKAMNSEPDTKPAQQDLFLMKDFVKVEGYKKRKIYITGPSPSINFSSKFWRMVWENKTSLVVMVSPSRTAEMAKVDEAYWPKQGAKYKTKRGDFVVSGHSTQYFTDFITRVFQIHHNEEDRFVYHLEFLCWPYAEIFPSVLHVLEFHQKYLNLARAHGSVGPIIIHCTDGTRRTGMFAALDWVIDRLAGDKLLKITQTILDLQNQGLVPVSEKEDLRYLHEIIAHIVTVGFAPHKDALIESYERPRLMSRKDNSNSDFQNLYEDCRLILDTGTKNYEYVSVGQSNVQHTSDTSDTYYNVGDVFSGAESRTTKVDSYRQGEYFLVAMTPTATQVSGYINLLIEKRCCVVLILDTEETLQGLYKSYTSETGTKVFMTSNDVQQKYSQRTMILEHHDKDNKRSRHEVEVIQVREWPKSDIPDAQWLLDLVILVKDECTQHPGHPVLIHCRDGGVRAGLFCALFNVMEKADHEEYINVAATVLRIQSQLPTAVQTLEEFKFCFGASMIYLNNQSDAYTPLFSTAHSDS